MTEQQAAELLALLRQIAADVSAIKAQGNAAAKAASRRSVLDDECFLRVATSS